MEKRQLEIVQYNPSLKVTYGPSTEDNKIKYTKYGVIQFIRNGTEIEVKTPTSVNFNIISKDDFSKYDSTKIYPKIIKTITRDQETQPPGAKDIYEDNEAKWDEEERQKYFIVEQADSVPYSGTKRSLFFQPNHNETHCQIEIKFKKDGEDHIINVDVDLLDADHSVFKGNATEKGYLALSRSCSKMGNYQEWINFLNSDFPDTIPAWENKAMTIKNPGDLDMPFQVYYEFNDEDIISEDKIFLDDNNFIQFSDIEKIGNDVGIIVDTYLRVIRGYTVDETTLKKIPNENVYNRYITKGDFFYIPSGESVLTSKNNPHIVYEYRYF